MERDQLSRKLAVILHADVVGSTSLVQKNETLAHKRITSAFQQFSETIRQYGGRVHEIRGDAILAEFARASDAVCATLAFQQENTKQNKTLEDDIVPELRVGVALGEVVISDNTITGAGVVLAQRIEQLCEPGSVNITEAIRESLPDRLPIDSDNLGKHSLKGFDKSVRVYAVKLQTDIEVPPPEPPQVIKHSRLPLVAAAISIFLVIAVALLWLKPWQPDMSLASVERMAFPLPEKPSIVILPFDNLSGEPKQEVFVDGLTGDIISELTRYPEFFVIARQSSFAYKNKPVTVRQVAEELGVQYLVEGSIERTTKQFRISAQLIDALTGRHVWADRYEVPLEDTLVARDEVVRAIVSSFPGKIERAESARASRRGIDSLSAQELVYRGWHHWRKFTKAENAESGRLFAKAAELDPESDRAYRGLAWFYAHEFEHRWGDNPETSLDLGLSTARKALSIAPDHYASHWALGTIYTYLKQFDQAVAAYDRALELNPNDASLLAGSSELMFYMGKSDEAIGRLHRAMRLNPHHPQWYKAYLAAAYFEDRQYDNAIKTSKPLIGIGMPNTHNRLAASYAYLGNMEKAKDHAAKVLEQEPIFSIQIFAKSRSYRERSDLEHYLEGLRLAGLPETSPPALPDKPSIAVLPFTNMSDDPKQEYFADGMTEDLITDLSKISGLFVIARNSSFSYKGQQVKVQQVAHELGVRYVMEGSVRRAGNQVRINAQLIDATTGGHLWAERYDGSMQDIFALTDQVTQLIVSALKVKLTVEEAAQQAQHSTDNAEAHDAFLQGWAHYKLGARADLARSIPFFEEAVRLDPGYADAHAALATAYWDSLERDWFFDLGIPSFEAEDRANHHLEEALNKPNLLVHEQLSRIYLSQGLTDEALREAEKALSLDPNGASAHAALANTLILTNRPQEGLDAIRKAIRLDPFHPPQYLTMLGAALFGLEQFEPAVTSFERAIKRNPDSEMSYIYLASAYGHLGNLREADDTIQRANVLRAANSLEPLRFESDTITGCNPIPDTIDFPLFGPQQIQDRLRLGLSKIPALNSKYLEIGPTSGSSEQTYDSVMGTWRFRYMGPDCSLVKGQLTIVDMIKATYPVWNGRIFWYATDDQRAWEGHWIEDAGGKCVDEKDGSNFWGVATFRFNESYTRWNGEFDFCGQGRKYPWNGSR